MQSNSGASSATFGLGTTLNYPNQTLNILQAQVQQTHQPNAQPNLINQTAANFLQHLTMQQQQQQQQQQLQQQQQQQQQQQPQQKDTTFTKIFVGGLPYHTTDESLKIFFQRFGNIEEAVVITDRSTGKSRGYGFVTMETKEAAEAAVLDPNPIIDGRKANVNLAYLGVKSRVLQPTSFIPFTIARYSIPSATTTYGIHPLYYHQLAGANPSQTYQLAAAAPTNLLLPAQASSLATNNTFSPLSNNSNNGLFDLTTAAYNSHLTTASTALNPNRTSPFETQLTASNQFLPFNTSNPTNQNGLNSVLTASASATQPTANYFTLASQHLSTAFQSQ